MGRSIVASVAASSSVVGLAASSSVAGPATSSSAVSLAASSSVAGLAASSSVAGLAAYHCKVFASTVALRCKLAGPDCKAFASLAFRCLHFDPKLLDLRLLIPRRPSMHRK